MPMNYRLGFFMSIPADGANQRKNCRRPDWVIITLLFHAFNWVTGKSIVFVAGIHSISFISRAPWHPWGCSSITLR